MNQGFFSEEEKVIKRGDEKLHIKRVANIKTGCSSCGLSTTCNSPKMGVQGEGKKQILIIMDHISSADDESGIYLSSVSGIIIRNIFNKYLNIDEDCWITSAVQCYSEKKLKGLQLKACANKIKKIVADLQPAVIVTLGKNSIDALIQYKMTGRLSGLSLTDWARCTIPDQEYKSFICPTWDGSYLLANRGGTDPVILRQMKAHIKEAVRLSTVPFYIAPGYSSEVIIIDNVKDALEIVEEFILYKKQFSFDYETTGIKPHREGHEIVCASISDGAFAWAFPFFNDEEFRDTWARLMLCSAGKIIHNAKYESIWTLIRAGYNNTKGARVKNIIADTMLDAHVIHNKKKTNLKFHVYVNFGIAGYDAAIDPYMEPSQEEKDKYGANAFNRMKEAPVKEMLLYNGLDSLFEYKLWELQKGRLDEHTKKGSELLFSAMPEFARMENNGMLLDEKQARIEYTKLTRKMSRLEFSINESDEIKLWDKPKAFRPSAPGDLTHLLFDCIKVKYDKNNVTKTNKPKADIEAMEKYDNEIVKLTLQWRKYKKVRDTDLNGFLKESVNGIIHTSINLNTVDTYRTSSNDPNLQNIPARDQEIMNLLRKLIIARPGHKLGEYDYKAAEAVLIAVYNGDPNWIKYVSDVSNDMHRDMAARLIMRKKEDVLKDERQIAKNGFVFPTVYTSYWKNTAKNMWDQFSPETLVHLYDKGINNLEDYRSHVQSVERWFWEDQFPVGYEWMNKTLKDYEKKGYIELLTGFRCYGPMTRAQVINFRVQGTASNCKLWTLDKVSKLMTKKKMNSKIILEIHDSIIPDIDPAEEDYLDYQMWLYGTQKIREHWPWLNVPMFIEKKISAIGGNWATMENKGLLKGDY